MQNAENLLQLNCNVMTLIYIAYTAKKLNNIMLQTAQQ